MDDRIHQRYEKPTISQNDEMTSADPCSEWATFPFRAATSSRNRGPVLA